MKLRPYLRNKFSLAGALALVFSFVFDPPSLKAINVLPEDALTMTGGHVTVNDDDANANDEWDKEDNGSLPNTKPLLRPFYLNARGVHGGGIVKIDDSGLRVNDVIHAKLWADAEKKEPLVLEYPVHPALGLKVTAWVEGIEPTEKIDSLELNATYEPKVELYADTQAVASVKFGVFQVDLDVDSNNDNGLSVAGYTDAEDKIENAKNKPGKILSLDTGGDMDNDEIPDFADGCGIAGGLVPGLKLVPISVKLKAPIDLAKAKVKFIYNSSIPRLELDANGSIRDDGNGGYEILKPGLRLWRVDGDKRTSGNDVNASGGGDFIPSDKEIAWKDLTSNPTARDTTIYVEAVGVEEMTDLSFAESISIQITGKDLPTDVIDEIKVTLQRIKVDLDVDADHNGTISIDGPDDEQELTEGGLVFVGGKKVPIVIQKVLPDKSSWDDLKVTLTSDQNGSKIKVFDQAGTEITFNGTDNKFSFKSLPKTLYVQGETPSDNPRDVALTLAYDNVFVHCEDKIKLTVVQVDLDIGNVPDAKEESKGVYVANRVELKLNFGPKTLASGTLELDTVAGGSKVRIWTGATKGTEITLPKHWTIGKDTMPASLYVEGVATKDIELKLKYTNGSAVCEDTVKATVVDVKQNNDLWWFNGENPGGGYDIQATLTVQGVSTGTFTWEVTAGADKVNLNNGGNDGDSITATNDNTVLIKSEKESSSAGTVTNDITIRLTINGVAVSSFNTVVYSPNSLNHIANIDHNYSQLPPPYPNVNGYWCEIKYEILDQFSRRLPHNIPWNEDFNDDGANAVNGVSDFRGENWPWGSEAGWTVPPASAIDNLARANQIGLIPEALNVGNANSKVDHVIGVWYVGSSTIGKGVKVKANCKWQMYQDHGRHE